VRTVAIEGVRLGDRDRLRVSSHALKRSGFSKDIGVREADGGAGPEGGEDVAEEGIVGEAGEDAEAVGLAESEAAQCHARKCGRGGGGRRWPLEGAGAGGEAM